MSAAQYEPGTVAVATVRGVEGVRVFRYGQIGGCPGWVSGSYVKGFMHHADSQLADVRPLVVLDTEDFYNDAEHGERDRDLPRTLRLIASADGPTYRARIVNRVADAIAAQARPPKPDEPTGLGAVARDRKGRLFVVDGMDVPARWRYVEAGWREVWDAIDAVEVLSPGVTP